MNGIVSIDCFGLVIVAFRSSIIKTGVCSPIPSTRLNRLELLKLWLCIVFGLMNKSNCLIVIQFSWFEMVPGTLIGETSANQCWVMKKDNRFKTIFKRLFHWFNFPLADGPWILNNSLFKHIQNIKLINFDKA